MQWSSEKVTVAGERESSACLPHLNLPKYLELSCAELGTEKDAAEVALERVRMHAFAEHNDRQGLYRN